jgi:hypothetical protein
MKPFLKHLIIASVALVCVGTSSMEAQIQRPRKFSLGVFGGFGADLNNVNFLELPTSAIFSPRTGGTNEPAAFGGNTAIGTFSAGIVMEYQITDQLSVGLRGSYATQNAALRTTSTYRVGRSDGTFDDAMSEFTLNSTVQYISVEPMAGYNLFEGLNVHLGARVNLLIGSSYTQKETLLTPTDGGFFTSGGRVRNERSGVLPNAASLAVAPLAGLSYNINLTDRLVLTPEAFFALGIMPVVSDLPTSSAWTTSSARAGISVKYKF